MKLSQSSVQRPITTIMVFAAVLIFGLVGFSMLKIDVLPDIEYPALTIITVYPGASAHEVEQQVTRPIEESLASVSNLKSIRSKSQENVSFVYLDFNWNTDLSDASDDARDRLEFAKRHLPDDAENPILSKFNSSMLPVLTYGIEANESYNGLDKIIDNYITNRLERLEGVGSILVIGQPTREIKVELNPYKLKSYGLSIAQIATILEMENVTIPGGSIKLGKNDLAISIPGEFENISDIEETVLASFQGKIIRVGDVATVTDSFKERDERMRSSQKEAVGIMIQKQSGSNTVEVVNKVRVEIDDIQHLLPSDVKIRELVDSSELVTSSLNNLAETIAWAALFVILVVFMFLREWRSSLIVILTIPFSLIVAFIFMFIVGYTINIFSMMALVIAIGMVVDNAIVVLENITRHIEKGERVHESAIFGASEMGMAISASTMTTLAVFLPMFFIGGLVGILFKQLALITSITMLASLLTALTLTPVLSSTLLKSANSRPKRHNRIFSLSEKIFVSIENSYLSGLKWCLRHRSITYITAIAIFVVTILLGSRIGTDYIPQFDAGDVMGRVELEVGVRTDETLRIAKQVENIYLEEIPKDQLKAIFTVAGQTESGLLSMTGFKEGKNCATVVAKIVKPDFRDQSAAYYADRIRQRVDQIPEIVTYSISGGSMLGKGMMGNASPVEVRIMGNNYDLLNEAALSIEDRFNELDYLKNVETTIDRGKLELAVLVDRDKAQSMGLNSAMIGMAIRQSVYGLEASEFSEGGEEYKIMVRYSPEFRNDINQIRNINLTTLQGIQVPLSSVARIEEQRSPLEITHESQQRTIYVKAELNDVSLGEAVEKVNTVLEEMSFPSEIIVEFGGQFEDQQDSFSSLYLLFIIGILIVYMVMAAQFESLKHPFIIMFAIPLSIIGIIIAFFITGTTLSVVTFIGVIMLLGIVVNNGIVLVDYTNLLRARGRNLLDAAHEAGHSRLRPVLMTAFTTIFAMLPMAASSGMGAEMWSPLGITVIGGLLFSTLITLILIPVIYVSMHRKELKKMSD